MFVVYALNGDDYIPVTIYDRREAQEFANQGHIVVEYARVGFIKKEPDAQNS